MARRIIALVAVLAGLAAAATVAAAPEPRAEGATSCTPTSLPLTDDGVLTVGTDNPAYPPWFGGGERKGTPWKINDPATGQGYESAVAYAVAKRLGFTPRQVKWVTVPFTRSFAPGKKPFDFFVNQVSYTPERARNVSFSRSYYDVSQAVVALKGTPISRARTVAALRGFKLGAPIGTTSYAIITNRVRPEESAAVYDTLNDGVTALKNRQIDGLVVDLPTSFFITGAQIPNSTIVGQFPAQGAQEYFGLVMQRGSGIVSCVDRAVAALRSNGTLRRLERRWLAAPAGAPFLR